MECLGDDKSTVETVMSRFVEDPSPENFGAVVEEHIGMVRNVALRIVLRERDADDIAQVPFISAYRNFADYRGDAKFATWLCRIAVNKAYSLLRSTKRSRTESLSELFVEPASSPLSRPESELISREELNEIHDAVAALPEHLRATLVLVAIDETPVDEAAYILNCNKATLYWRLHKARKLLADSLKSRSV